MGRCCRWIRIKIKIRKVIVSRNKCNWGRKNNNKVCIVVMVVAVIDWFNDYYDDLLIKNIDLLIKNINLRFKYNDNILFLFSFL